MCPFLLRGYHEGESVFEICGWPDGAIYLKSVTKAGCEACQPPDTVCVQPAERQTLIGKSVSYTKAIVDWIKAGRPARSPSLTEQIFYSICLPCSDYDEGACRICGCVVSPIGGPLLNKIAMATQHCPKNLW